MLPVLQRLVTVSSSLMAHDVVTLDVSQSHAKDKHAKISIYRQHVKFAFQDILRM